MSFILDALKKSEEERLRQQNPSTLPTALPRSNGRTPAWVWALLCLLVVNLVVLAVVLLKPRADVPTIAATPVVVAAAVVPTETITKAAPSAPKLNGVDEEAAPDSQGSGIATQSAPVTTPPSLPASLPASVPASVPTRNQQLAAGANLPPATLNLHVFDADRTKRFVLLNGERLREGDTNRDGLTVVTITPEGVVLSFGAASFAVSIEGR
jgi:general secretion pathway protein B